MNTNTGLQCRLPNPRGFSLARFPSPKPWLHFSLFPFHRHLRHFPIHRRPISLFFALSPPPPPPFCRSHSLRCRLSPVIVRCLSTRSTTSPLRDPNPNWSNRPPKETILLDGCDFEHWLVVMESPQGDITRDEIINSYIKTLATVVGSEDEVRMKIYSVSTRCYYAFGALVSEVVSLKIKGDSALCWDFIIFLGLSSHIYMCVCVFVKFLQSCLESVGYFLIPTWMLRTKIMEVNLLLMAKQCHMIPSTMKNR